MPVWVKKGSLALPKDQQTPIIMVGPGTGIAVFRSYIQHYKGPMVLLFGCRDRQKDFYYSQEWPKHQNLTVITAFSREEGQDKQYVQHKIKEE